jgi:hypothetical protein
MDRNTWRIYLELIDGTAQFVPSDKTTIQFLESAKSTESITLVLLVANLRGVFPYFYTADDAPNTLCEIGADWVGLINRTLCVDFKTAMVYNSVLKKMKPTDNLFTPAFSTSNLQVLNIFNKDLVRVRTYNDISYLFVNSNKYVSTRSDLCTINFT